MIIVSGQSTTASGRSGRKELQKKSMNGHGMYPACFYEERNVNIQDIQEQREHNRFKVADRLVTLFSYDHLCLPVDISAGGLAVKASGDDNGRLPLQWKIDILLRGESFHAEIPLRLAWKMKRDHTYFPNLFGFQFGELTETNRSKLDYLIQLHEEILAGEPLRVEDIL